MSIFRILGHRHIFKVFLEIYTQNAWEQFRQNSWKSFIVWNFEESEMCPFEFRSESNLCRILHFFIY